jgi:sodium/hydrogen antiporter
VEHFVTTIALVGIVIIVASLLSGVLERSGMPLVGVFLLLGAALGPYGLGVADIGLESPVLHALATLGLALVLFSDAVTVEIGDLRGRKRLAWRLIGPGTLVPAILIALAAWLLLDVPGPAAAILGAALASTDPVLLRSVLRARALPAAARVALRLESGVNDVVLLPIVVLAMLLLRGTATGQPVTTTEVARSAVGLFVLGPALGAVVGWLGITVLVRIRSGIGVRRDYESLYALGLAFTGFAVAEAVGGSGFLAAFAAGLVVAAQDVELCDCFLEYGEATAEMLLLLTFVAFGTSLIWTGLELLDWRTVLFAIVALTVRSIVLYPILTGVGASERDRRLIALFGPRGLSSLLLTLLPVFARIPGAERLFTITCLVVLMSVVLHGGGIALFLRANSGKRRPTPGGGTPGDLVTGPVNAPRPAIVREPLPTVPAPADFATRAAEREVSDRIDIHELREMMSRGDPLIVVDSRAERSHRADAIQAAGAVRIPPEDAVRSATEKALSQHATLVVYCA